MKLYRVIHSYTKPSPMRYLPSRIRMRVEDVYFVIASSAKAAHKKALDEAPTLYRRDGKWNTVVAPHGVYCMSVLF